MTDRHAGYIVTLTEDVRGEDDAQYIINALKMIKGVANVTPIVADHAQVIARVRRDGEWMDALAELARSGPGPSCPQYRGGAVHRPHDGCPGYHWD